MISVIEPALVWDDRSSGYQVRVTAGGAHTEKLEHGPRYGFGLFQHHEVSGMSQVDHSHPLAQLLTQRMPVPPTAPRAPGPSRGGAGPPSSLGTRRGGGAPPLHQSSRGTFRLVARCARWTAGQHSTCSSTLGSDAGESQRAPNMVTQSLPF